MFEKDTPTLSGIYLKLNKTGISTTVGPHNENIGGDSYKEDYTTPEDNFISNAVTIKPLKTKKATILLALFLGIFGAHRFYLGQYWRGTFSVLFFWTRIPMIISWIDVVIFAIMSNEKFNAKYNNPFVPAPSAKADQQSCSGCGTPLTFMSKPNFGGGKLKGGGRVCRACFAQIVKVDVGFGMNSSRKYDVARVREVLWGEGAGKLFPDPVYQGDISIPTSRELGDLKAHIESAMQKKPVFQEKIRQQYVHVQRLNKKLENKQRGTGKLLTKQQSVADLQSEVKAAKKSLADLHKQYRKSLANVSIESDQELQEQYQKVKSAYLALLKTEKIWRIISERKPGDPGNMVQLVLERWDVNFAFKGADFILSEYPAFHLEAGRDNSLFIYPGFILQMQKSNEIALIALHELQFRFYREHFIEDKEKVPVDSRKVDPGVDKDGISGSTVVVNHAQSVAEYGALEFYTESGLNIIYHVSNVRLAEQFALEFRQYLSLFASSAASSSAQTKGSSMKPFTYGYYYLLKEFSGSLRTVASKLQNDEVLLTHMDTGHSEYTPAALIASCITYDMVQLYKMLTAHRHLSYYGLEACGLVLTTSQLQPDFHGNLLDNDYEALESAYRQSVYKDVAEQLNTMTFGSLDSFMESAAHKSLLFPAFLKSLDNPVFDEYATMLYRFATIISKADNIVSEEEEKILKKIYQLTHNPAPDKKKHAAHISKGVENESIDDVLSELNSLIGLNAVKSEINTLINFIKVQRAREESGLKSSSLSYHIVFTGNPGTGKTTVARIVSRIYKHLGILTEGQLVETDRSGLVGEYVGHTAVKVNKIVDSALNGILFVDEAYALVGQNKDDFGKEAVATLIKRMEDDRDKLVLILAGYTKEMETFIDTNPGFKSRFNRYITFPDYEPEELFAIFESNCKKLDYHITDPAKVKLKNVFEKAFSARDRSFGNGRFVRNVFEKTLEKQANRIAAVSGLTKEILTTINEEDIAAE